MTESDGESLHGTVVFRYTMLEGSWPVLGQATPCSDYVFEQIKSAANGAAITEQLGFLSLGTFCIHTSLVESHATQRPLNPAHVKALKESFETKGIMRGENMGVVIGLGDGWANMKNNGPLPCMITDKFPHLPHLTSSDGQIAQVIRGGHRTQAIKEYAEELDKPEENYWLYTVLVPGKL
jgi:hypothetical protein